MTVSLRIIDRNAFRAPIVPDRFTSWANATIEVGKHLFGDDWAEAELARADYLAADRAADVEAEVQKRYPVVNLPKAVAPPRQPALSGNPIKPETLELIREGAQRIRAERESHASEVSASMPKLAELIAINKGRKDRLGKAHEKLSRAAINADIPTYWYRDNSASEPQKMPLGELVKAWNSLEGRANLIRKGYVWRDRVAWYVYFDASKLAEKFPFDSMPVQTVGNIPLESLSPYLRLAIAVSIKEGVTEDCRLTPENLRDTMLAEASKFGLSVGSGNDGSDLSKTWAKEIAKALRWPAARLGQAEGRTQKR